MPVVEISLESFGLISVAGAAERRGCTVRTVQNWIAAGLLPVAIAGQGPQRATYLLRVKDVDRLKKPTRGAPRKPKPTRVKPGGKVQL